jgi:hypothetical protein
VPDGRPPWPAGANDRDTTLFPRGLSAAGRAATTAATAAAPAPCVVGGRGYAVLALADGSERLVCVDLSPASEGRLVWAVDAAAVPPGVQILCAVGALPADWNIYSPRWAPVQVVEAGAPAGHALELRDEDPYDYARAVRVFPETHGLKLSVKVLARQTDARLEIDLLDARGARPVQLAFAEDGHLWARHEGIWNDAGPYTAGRWMTLTLDIKPAVTSDTAELRVDGQPVLTRAMVFTDPVNSVERVSFRTGVFRNRGLAGKELSGADIKAPLASFLVDDVVITPVP